jgi:hypothetical protein
VRPYAHPNTIIVAHVFVRAAFGCHMEANFHQADGAVVILMKLEHGFVLAGHTL